MSGVIATAKRSATRGDLARALGRNEAGGDELGGGTKGSFHRYFLRD